MMSPFKWIFKVFTNWLKKKPDTNEQMYRICEGSHDYHYHLCLITGDSKTSICGTATLHCTAPLNSWGSPSESIPDTYCKVCEELAKNNQEMKAGC